ncbi:helix-turn-helix domain-containing protein [Orrella sp. JC864]|uniref:helix-turn-helix domain-containing protein n=1 Tax=Orrella sp. JC864 TaxID=3120298 RepID=UPI0012BC449C
MVQAYSGCSVQASQAYGDLVSRTTDDAGEQAELLRAVPRRYYQTGMGRYLGGFDGFMLPDIIYGREWQNQPLLRCVAMPPDLCTFFVPSRPADAMRVDVRQVETGAIAYQPAGSDFDVHTCSGSGVVYFTVSQQALRQAAMTLDPELWESRIGEPLILKVADAGLVRKLVDGAIAAAPYWLAAGMEQSWAHELRQSSLSALLGAVGQACDARHPRNRAQQGLLHAGQLARRARDFIEGMLPRRVTVLDICGELGVSRRTLQDVFQRVLGMSPVSYLRMVRLHRARQDLRRPVLPSVSVGQVATRWGFLHPSQFSVDYQRLFGELPSYTLRKAYAGSPGAAYRPAPGAAARA